MKKHPSILMTLLMAATLLLAACGPRPAEPVVTDVTATPAPLDEVIQIRWFVGLGTGTDPAQVEVEQALVDAFNDTHDSIELVLEVVPYDSARESLATLFASGQGPDVIGPVDWAGANEFFGEWLELSPYMSAFDASTIDPALIAMYHNEAQGQLGLPFLVSPSAIFYLPALFNQAGLNMPPTEWGGNYVMPDGAEVAWDYTAFTYVARMLTIDSRGRNALESGFDRTRVVQYGFHPGLSGHPAALGAYQGVPAFYTGEAGSYVAAIPDSWKAAWEWYYEGVWGAQPFIPSDAVVKTPDFGNGNAFASGKVAMTMTHLWYTCCLGNLSAAGFEFQFAAIPVGSDGVPHGRVDAETFRIWKGSEHPAEAFEVLAFLLGPVGTEYLVVGLPGRVAAYSGLPALPAYQQPFLDAMAAQYPFVTTWDVILSGLAFPDVPVAMGYPPNWSEAWARMQTFGNRMVTTEGLDLPAEIAALETELTVIYNK